MKPVASSLWRSPLPVGWQERLDRLAASAQQTRVFFRADDIAVADERFQQMMALFRRYEVPLCLAVVPAWMDQGRLAALQRFDLADPLWCWHQHGFAHQNHERTGRKCEFGSSRSAGEVRDDLQAGRTILEDLFGECFTPVFTPPWNRCTGLVLDMLPSLGYRAVSRFRDAVPACDCLPDLAPSVDLHTGKEPDPARAWSSLWDSISRGLESGLLGFMLHHERMNAQAFGFLDGLLHCVSSLNLCHFGDLLDDETKEFSCFP